MRKLLLTACVIGLAAMTSLVFADDQNQMQTAPANTTATQPATTTTTTTDTNSADQMKKNDDQMMMNQNNNGTTQPAAQPNQADTTKTN